MDELIARVTQKTGLDQATARKAIGLILGYLQKEGPQAEVNQLHRTFSELSAQVGALRTKAEQTAERVRRIDAEIADLDRDHEAILDGRKQVVVAPGPGLQDRDPGRRVRHEDVQQPVPTPADERRAGVSDVQDHLVVPGVQLDQLGVPHLERERRLLRRRADLLAPGGPRDRLHLADAEPQRLHGEAARPELRGDYASVLFVLERM